MTIHAKIEYFTPLEALKTKEGKVVTNFGMPVKKRQIKLVHTYINDDGDLAEDSFYVTYFQQYPTDEQLEEMMENETEMDFELVAKAKSTPEGRIYNTLTLGQIN